MQSALTLHKHIAQKEYAQSPLGKIEKQIKQFYDDLYLKRVKLSEEEVKQVNAIRTENEELVTDYIKKRETEDREAIDEMLLQSMTKELVILKANQEKPLPMNK